MTHPTAWGLCPVSGLSDQICIYPILGAEFAITGKAALAQLLSALPERPALAVFQCRTANNFDERACPANLFRKHFRADIWEEIP
jgi:hypothetical protein